MEELRKYLEERISITNKQLNDLKAMYKHNPIDFIDDIDGYEFSSKIEAYQEIIDYIDNIKNKVIMFTQECFIRKRNESLIQSLINLGYKFPTQTKGNAISNSSNGVIVELILLGEDKLDSIIDCGTNEEMFLALAALRDDSDMDQWFVCNEDSTFWTLCVHDEFHFIQINPDDIMQYLDWKDDFHKATPQEIIKHFKK